MTRTLSNQTIDKIGETVTLQGWVDAKRDHGKITFIELRDRSGNVQCVGYQKMSDLTPESVVSITGLVKARPEKMINPDHPTGTVEIDVQEYQVLSQAEELPIPIDESDDNEAAIQKRLDWRWIDLRRAKNLQIFQVWTELERGFRNYYNQNNYMQIYTPAFMNTASESGSEVFEVKYFDRKAFLAQSPQFYKQMAMAAGFEKVFMVGSVFRAEPSFTTRHMTEFTGWDFEISYIDSHYQVMEELEKVITSGFIQVKESLNLDIEIPALPFPKLSMAEAKKKLAALGIKSEKAGDLSPEEEREICKLIKQETGHDFVFITEYPIDVRPFYHMRVEDNPQLTKSFDLLYKGLEITTGAQREHRVEKLLAQAKDKNMDVEPLQNYINFFRYGCPPHGGVGIGPGRIIMQMLGLSSIKETAFLPRDVRRLTP